jgi:hypothetical protein
MGKLEEWIKIISNITWNTNFEWDKISISYLHELSNLVKENLEKKGIKITVKYWDEVVSGKRNKRLQVIWSVHWLMWKNGISPIDDSAWIRTDENPENLCEFEESIIDFLNDLNNINQWVNLEKIQKGPYWWKNW